MNPLTVLTGVMVIRTCEQMDRADGALCLDDSRRYRLTLGADRAPATPSPLSLIQLRKKIGHPVVLAQDGPVLGVCGETEIVRALAVRD